MSRNQNAPIDISKAKDVAGGSVALAEELYSLLIKELASNHQLLSELLPHRDADVLSAIAHKLRSSARYCAALNLELAAEAAEQAAIRSVATDQMSEARDGLLRAVNEILHLQNPYSEASR